MRDLALAGAVPHCIVLSFEPLLNPIPFACSTLCTQALWLLFPPLFFPLLVQSTPGSNTTALKQTIEADESGLITHLFPLLPCARLGQPELVEL